MQKQLKKCDGKKTIFFLHFHRKNDNSTFHRGFMTLITVCKFGVSLGDLLEWTKRKLVCLWTVEGFLKATIRL